MKNIKFIYFILCLLTISTVIGQDESDIIVWGEKTLVWADFSGETDQSTSHLASTHSRLRVPNSWNADTLTLSITAEFVRSKSWVKGTPSDNLLKHERLHFDITEYHARLFRKTILNYRFKSFDSITTEVTDLFNERFGIYRDMQESYDHETNHSKNLDAQEVWDAKIKHLLEETNDYKSHDCHVYIGYLE